MDPVLLEKAIIDRKEKTGKYPKAIVPVALGACPELVEGVCRIRLTRSWPLRISTASLWWRMLPRVWARASMARCWATAEIDDVDNIGPHKGEPTPSSARVSTYENKQ